MREIRLCDDCKKEMTVNLCRENKLGIEIQTFHDPYLENQDVLVSEYQDLLSGLPGGRSLHAPFWELNIGTKMRGIQKETMEMFQYAYRIAQRLGCTEVVVHNGYIPGTSLYSGWVQRAAAFWRRFFQNKDDSIILCIENQFEEDSELMKMEIDEVHDPRLKICLDIGHAHANSRQSAEEWIASLGERIHYLHLHNNHGKQHQKGHNDDEHLALQNGTMDIQKILRTAERFCPNAIWAVESSAPYLRESVCDLKNMGYLR